MKALKKKNQKKKVLKKKSASSTPKGSKKSSVLRKFPKKSTKPTKRFVPTVEKGVLFRKNADGQIAIMRIDNEESFYTLSEIAADFWTMIDGKSSVDQIKEKLVKKHAPPLARFEKDLAKLITQLKKEKLIKSA